MQGVQITRALSMAYPIGPEPQGTARAFLEFLRFRRDLMAPGRSKPRPVRIPARAR